MDLFDDMFLSGVWGKQPLLKDVDEIDVAREVFDTAKAFFDARLDSLPPKTTQDGLRTVTDVFFLAMLVDDTNSDADMSFQKCLPALKECRLRTIRKLEEIADSIHKDRFNGNISKIVGGCTGAVGTGVAIAALAAPLAAPVVLPMTVAGAVASTLGGGTVFGTSAVEAAAMKRKMSEAVALATEDRRACEEVARDGYGLASALAYCLASSVGRMMGISGVVWKMSKDVERFRTELGVTKKAPFDSGLARPCRDSLRASVEEICASSTIASVFDARLAPIVATFACVACLLSPKNMLARETTDFVGGRKLGLASVLHAGFELAHLVGDATLQCHAAAAKIIPHAVARAWAHGAFAGVGMAIDVASVAVASVDLHKGSKSEQAEAVREAVKGLREELRILDENFKMFSTINGKDIDEVCTICFEDMTPQTAREVDCGHTFHLNCIKEWMNMTGYCPMRRVHM